MFKEKVEKFYSAMKEKGYEVELVEESVKPFSYELQHLVTKEGIYHITIAEKLITEAPMDYLKGLVDEEFKRLEKQVAQ